MNGMNNDSTDRPIAAPLMYINLIPNFLDNGMEAALTTNDKNINAT